VVDVVEVVLVVIGLIMAAKVVVGRLNVMALVVEEYGYEMRSPGEVVNG
jgi:hypothetical protein